MGFLPYRVAWGKEAASSSQLCAVDRYWCNYFESARHVSVRATRKASEAVIQEAETD